MKKGKMWKAGAAGMMAAGTGQPEKGTDVQAYGQQFLL